MKQLIFGGARSGKSRLAEHLTGLYGDTIAYIATADAQFHDAEMTARVVHHRQQRPPHWHTLEVPCELGASLRAEASNYDAIIVDCLTLWLTNCLMAEERHPDFWSQQKQRFLSALDEIRTPVILVSNEVGMGIVPLGELNRRFVDEAGFLNQATARLCDRVIFTAAGCPLVMKGTALSHTELQE
ncbi:bifunctional adenosylcobinamide kinase/adenosylcobinamide-phosphate guanylyltransferase [Aestuariicella hydrocarbonica]|uniref:Bifunctional adenosylcobalamin biosynthesis protein n=1 Tax=Pseudomaricurvus hydrocarbonicus TaxID=1470433 RepID=A0A9E5MLN4_9GAMM|nr:bifunctional adenosylcobinamide kinase/adenosylcobinamide-phosphate guanylyltransferase [Aestuariicella hydrocarbonica]NHO64250.1 bifunctional adenosylcobinamide kinase/adenosylcobinamide-phosphate guanylyltransferase [Aestuariicella hydrocarbonica]